MNSKAIELAKKLQALSVRGIGGEKDTAVRFLAKLMSESNISFDDLETIKRNLKQFTCKAEHRFLLVQTAGAILGIAAKIYKSKKGRRYVLAECTPSEEIEIKATFNFYKKAYEADLEIFRQAFIQKNRIFPRDGETVDPSNLPDEERERSFKAMLMAEGLSRHQLLKQLSMNKTKKEKTA